MASATAWRPLEDGSILKSLDENLLMLVLEQLRHLRACLVSGGHSQPRAAPRAGAGRR